MHSREVVVGATRGVVRDQFYSERLYDREELVGLLREYGFEIETGQKKETTNQECLNTVTAARELSQRGQDLGMMEQRLLIFAKKICDAPPMVCSIPIDSSVEYPISSKNRLNDTVRELIEKFRESVISEEYSERNISELILKDDGKEATLSDDASKSLTVSKISPTSYHLLPPPPFKNNTVSVIMGDTTMPCREKLNGVWNIEDFDTRRKLVKGLIDCGYAPEQVRSHSAKF